MILNLEISDITDMEIKAVLADKKATTMTIVREAQKFLHTTIGIPRHEVNDVTCYWLKTRGWMRRLIDQLKEIK